MGTRNTRKAKKVKGTKQSEKPRDFYREVSEKWVNDTELPDTETRITQAYFIQKEINKELAAIIDKQGGSMKDLLASWRNTEGRVPEGITSLIQIMLTMVSTSDISSRIGWMNRYGISPPLLIYVQGDPRDHKRCRIFIEEGQPRIGIPEYWQWPQYVGHRKAYARYVKSLAKTLDVPQMLMGYAAEREFAGVFPSILERQKRMNMLTWTELCEEYRVIDWTALFTAWGLDEAQLPNLVFNVTSQAFLHHLQKRVESWSLERWQGWFSLIVAQWIAGCSPHGPLRSAWFEYSRRFLQGMIADETVQELRYSFVSTLMPNTLGRMWITQHCHPDLRRHVRRMMEKIRTGAEMALKNTSWMTDSTKKAAIRKLRKMDVQVCWPDLDTWPKIESACGLTSTNLIGNMLSLGKLNTDENQTLLTSGDCRHPNGEGWGKPVFEVNAYYYPDENRFLLPAAILRPPFYDARKSIMSNYGAIGATIGHELCHAFDSDGRQYDENGDKRDWWSRHDDREYQKRARQVVRLYESRDYRGLDVDGELTLVENIADLGGIEFALAGVRLDLGRALTKTDLREFFTSYAISWRAKDRLKRAAELLATNTHAPPMLRVNHVVRQMDEWYEAFDIGPESPEWIPPARRIRFFA